MMQNFGTRKFTAPHPSHGDHEPLISWAPPADKNLNAALAPGLASGIELRATSHFKFTACLAMTPFRLSVMSISHFYQSLF